MKERASTAAATFGDLLKRLRKRAGMTQDDLAAASGYSRSLIGALERNDRLPNVEAVIRAYLPALGLQEEPLLAARLVELAAITRGERPLASLPLQLEGRMPIPTEDAGRAHCLPLPPTEILGRDDEISQICDRLLGRQARLMTLVGPPGVGKTRLALAVGMELQRFYRDGACFVPLAAVSDPALVASTLALALALLDDSAKPPQTRLIEHLRRKEMLLVLDSYEQLTSVSSPAVAVVAGLLTECPDLCILVTSRERLHLRAEQRYRVQPLALEAAVNLFAQRAVAVEGEFVLTTGNRPIIEAICHQVDRLPLALELCAAQMDLLSPSQLLAGLCDRRLELLVDGAQDLPPYQRTLRSAIGHSYDLLDEVERALFRSLGVFAGGCRLEAIEAVSASNERLSGHSLTSTLHGLINKSLVRAEDTPDGATRYVQMETIREYALEQAQAEGEEHLLRERHSAAYLQLFRLGDGGLRGPEAPVWLARMEPEQDNLRTALRWTLAEERYADMEWLLIAVNWFWHHTGNQAESYGWHRLLLPHRATLDARLRLALLISLHFLARTSEESRAIAPYTFEMMGLLEVCPEKTLQASAWCSYALRGENPAEARAALEQSIASARAAHDEPALGPEFGILADRDFILGDNLWAYAIRLLEQGDFARAALSLAESHQIFWARGNGYEMADSLAALGRLALLQGNLTEAGALLHEAVTLAKAFRSKSSVALHQPLLGLVTLYDGDAAEARRLLEDSLRICIDLSHEQPQAQICVYLAETALWEGQLDEAEQWLVRSLAHDADPRRADISQIERLLLAARLATAQGAFQRAAALFGLAEKLRSLLSYEFAGPVRLLAGDALAKVRATLGPAPFTEAFTAGQQLSLEDTFATLSASGTLAGAPILSI